MEQPTKSQPITDLLSMWVELQYQLRKTQEMQETFNKLMTREGFTKYQIKLEKFDDAPLKEQTPDLSKTE